MYNADGKCELFMIVLILEINHKIIHEDNKYSNVLYVHVHTFTHWHAHKKYINLLVYNNHIECVNDKQNSRLYNN